MSTAGTGYCAERRRASSAENLSRIVKGLPRKAQMVLRGLVQCRPVCLKLTLPDGRRVVDQGQGARARRLP